MQVAEIQKQKGETGADEVRSTLEIDWARDSERAKRIADLKDKTSLAVSE